MAWTLEWVPAEVIERMRGDYRLALFFRADLDPTPLRLWMGINDVPKEMRDIEEAGETVTYIGGGALREIPNLEILINGISDRVEFQLRGIDVQEAAKLDFESYDVRGREVHVGLTCLDDHHQPVSPIIPVWFGHGSFLTESSNPVGEGESPTVTIGMSVGGGITTRGRSSAVLWSAPHQTALWEEFFPTPELQAANPRDRGCDNTARLARGVETEWPDW